LAASLRGQTEDGVGFNYRVKGGWVIDLSSAAVRSAISVALTTAGLAAIGQSAAVVAAEVLVIVVPLLVDVRRIELTESEAYVHLKLRDAFRDHAQGHLTGDELYSLLPDEVKEQLSSLDFLDFVGRFTAAGLTTEDSAGRLAIHPRDEARLRITFE
jgi:hypothetical protein